MNAEEIVKVVHRRDELIQQANALAQLGKDVVALRKEFGFQEKYGASEDKVFRPLGLSQQNRLAELAMEHAGELRSEAEEIMRKLEER